MTIAEKLASLMALAYEVNSRTQYAVYVDFHGHVNWVSLRVAESKEQSTEIIFPENYRNGGRDWMSTRRDNLIRIDEWMTYLNGLLAEEGVVNI